MTDLILSWVLPEAIGGVLGFVLGFVLGRLHCASTRRRGM